LDRVQLVQSVEISTIAHATDDLGKVQAALRSILPDLLKEREIFTRRYVQGHYSNPIVTFDARISHRSEVEGFVESFVSRLPRTEKLIIQRDLDLYSDSEGNLYIRIDKQQALRGLLELSNEDPIRVKMKFTRFKGEAKELMKELLESE
jgi:RNA binding exosome subunit